jgi:hypothetical protein
MLATLREKVRKWRTARTQRKAEKMAQQQVSQENWGQQKAPPGGGTPCEASQARPRFNLSLRPGLSTPERDRSDIGAPRGAARRSACPARSHDATGRRDAGWLSLTYPSEMTQSPQRRSPGGSRRDLGAPDSHTGPFVLATGIPR